MTLSRAVRFTFLSSLSAAALFACAARGPAPTRELARSEAAVRTAENVGAAEDPQASLHLRLAQQQLEQAKELIDNREHERARWLLARALSDAELAAAVARENWTRAEAQRTAERVEALRHSTRSVR